VPLAVYNQRPVYPITGRSFLKELEGNHSRELHQEPVGEEQYGRAYLRKGSWKLVWTEPPAGPFDGHWQLYDIVKDRAETRDVSAQYPEIVKSLYKDWQTYLRNNGAVLAKKPGMPERRRPRLR
jgi:arylsulfatase A-like enzyme